MKKIVLDNRLALASSFVDRGSIVADIGTDHAYLPSFLVQNGISPFAYACDVRTGPLENARSTIKALGLEDKITTVLSDGLQNVDLNKVDTVILCGMGGDLICQILGRESISILSEKTIIAQPQSHCERVRRFFTENGFIIEKEKCAVSDNKDYVCMKAVKGERKAYPPYYEYYGEMCCDTDETAKRIIKKLIINYEQKAKHDKENSEYYTALVRRLCEITGEEA